MAVITALRLNGARYEAHRMALDVIAATTAGMQSADNRAFARERYWVPTSHLIPSSSGRADTSLISGPSAALAALYSRKTAGKISGTFKVNGVLKADARIVLLDRYAGQSIYTVRTNSVGYYEFPYLDLDHNKYVVVGIDPADNERAEAYDRVYPL